MRAILTLPHLLPSRSLRMREGDGADVAPCIRDQIDHEMWRGARNAVAASFGACGENSSPSIAQLSSLIAATMIEKAAEAESLTPLASSSLFGASGLNDLGGDRRREALDEVMSISAPIAGVTHPLFECLERLMALNEMVVHEESREQMMLHQGMSSSRRQSHRDRFKNYLTEGHGLTLEHTLDLKRVFKRTKV